MKTNLLKNCTWVIVCCLLSFFQLRAQQITPNGIIKKEIILGLNPDPLISIGAERIIKKSKDAPVDIFHSVSYKTGRSEKNKVIIILETYKNLPADIQKMIPDKPGKEDAFTVKTISSDPLIIIIIGSGYNARGTMYAAYKIAEMIEMDAPLEKIDNLYQPKIKDRFVYLKYDVSEGVAISGPQSGIRRQNLTSKSLKELPLYGVNGVMMTDHPIFPWFPFEMSDTLTYKIEPQATDLKAIFQDIAQYGLEVNLHYPYFVFPDYTHDEIEEYLTGKKDIPGFIEYFNKYHEKRLEALFRFFPEINGLNLGGPEGTIGFISAFPSNGILKDHQSDERGLLVLENYLKVVTKVAKKYNKKTFFWTHNWGQTNVQMRLLREMLYKFPTVGVLEDAQWNNSGWANLPIMGYLSKDLQKDMGKYNDYYMMAFADGEGLGGGGLPNSIPEPLYEVGQEIVDRNFKGIVSRIDVQDKTSLGSLFNMNEINMIASMAPLWAPVKSMDELWEKWVERRFGKEAAPELLLVLKSSKEIIFNGYMISGVPLLYHSKFETKNWLNKNPSLFRRTDLLLIEPGTPMVKKTEKDIINSGEYVPFQLNAKAVAIKKVREDQERAIELCRQGANTIKKLKGKLVPADYEYLLTTYNTAYYLFKGVRAATEGLYFDNINKNNFDKVKDPKTELKKATENIRNSAQEIKSQIGTDHFDQDFYYLPAALIEYANGLKKKWDNHN